MQNAFKSCKVACLAYHTSKIKQRSKNQQGEFSISTMHIDQYQGFHCW